jgi:hypothetical protein
MEVIEKDGKQFVSIKDLEFFIMLFGESADDLHEEGLLSDAQLIMNIKTLLSVATMLEVAAGNDVSRFPPELVKESENVLAEMEAMRFVDKLTKEFKDMGVDVLSI